MNIKRSLYACGTPRNFILFLVLIGLLTAYPGFSAAGDSQHACDFLSIDEVAPILGFELSAPERKPANPLGQSICFFDAPQAPGIKFAQLQLVTSTSEKLKDKGFTAASYFDTIVGYMDSPLPVDGVGERAFWGGSAISMGAGLHVHYQNAYFVVLLKSENDADSLSKSKELAGIVISKMK